LFQFYAVSLLFLFLVAIQAQIENFSDLQDFKNEIDKSTNISQDSISHSLLANLL